MANRFINSLVHSIHFIFIAAIFSLLLVAYLKISNTEYKYIHTIGKNWNRGPLQTISATQGSCPLEETYLLDGEWPGTTDGCDCSNLSFNLFSNPLERGTCSSLKSKYRNRSTKSSTSFNISPYDRCIDVRPTPAIPYKNWGGRTMCGKRIPQSYLDLIIVKDSLSCPTETKSCGAADSLGNFLCVPTSSPCPINKLLFLENKDQIPGDFKYTVIQLSTNKKIVYTNENVTGEIVQELKLSEGQPCLDPSYENINSDQYLLSNLLDRNGCPETGDKQQMFDHRFIKIDSDDLFDFYTMNGIEDTLRRLPQYKPTSSFSFIDLYAREYFGLTNECRARVFESNEGTTGLLKTLLFFEDNVGSIVGWVLGTFIIAVIALAIEIYIPCCVCLNDNNKLNKLPMFMLILNFIFSSALIICNSIAYSKISNLPDNYTLLNGNCSDAETNLIIENFVGNFGVGVTMTLFSLFIVIGTFLFNFFYIILGVIEKNELVEESDS